MTRATFFRQSLLASFALALISFCAASAPCAADNTLVVRLRVVDWQGPGFLYGPPYLAGYRSLKPATSGSEYLGKFQPQAKLAPHDVLLGRMLRKFRVRGGESDSDFVLVVSLSWYPQFQSMEAVRGTLQVSLDDQEPRPVPLEFVRGHTFFMHTGEGTRFSLPIAVVLDIPEGEHEVEIKIGSVPLGYLLVVAGEIDPKSSAEPPAEATSPPPGHGHEDGDDHSHDPGG